MLSRELISLAGRQFNRLSRGQLLELGLSHRVIDHEVGRGRLVPVEPGVYAILPVLEHDPWGRRMGATLTQPETTLSHDSAISAWGLGRSRSRYEIVTRPGSGGPRRFGGVLVHFSLTLDGDCTELRGIPITTVSRTILDVAASVSGRALARFVREAIRLELTSLDALGEALGHHRGKRGVRRLATALARYSGLPLARARSGAEVRALEHLKSHGRPMPQLNTRIAGEEADLSWRKRKLIVEIEVGPFHQDVGEDVRKESVWRSAGWTVRRLPAEDVYERPARLLRLAPG